MHTNTNGFCCRLLGTDLERPESADGERERELEEPEPELRLEPPMAISPDTCV